jgi:hypothetical protein
VVEPEPAAEPGAVVVVGAGSEPAPTEPAPTEPGPAVEPAPPAEPAPGVEPETRGGTRTHRCTGGFQSRPYTPRTVGDNNDAMYMIGHDHKRIEFALGHMIG